MLDTLFSWLNVRSVGVLLHPTSLPGPDGIGTLGKSAYRFIDFLSGCGFEYWQMCPLGPTGYGDSPYQTFSSFAGNPYLIDLEELVSWGLLKPEDLTPLGSLPKDRVDYGALYLRKWAILRLAFRRFSERAEDELSKGFESFCAENNPWLTPYASFMALKDRFGGASWTEWPDTYRIYERARGEFGDAGLQHQMQAYAFYQYLFFRQWESVRSYASDKGVHMIGDVPIFTAMDSSDVWSEPEYFQLDANLKPEGLAGVPPDYFSPLGQLWGNPLYRWSAMRGDGYQWWMRRLESAFRLYDVIRIDHFRGFDAYWKVPATDQDARNGEWISGPGLDFFKAVHSHFPDGRLIAEDLGVITDSMIALRVATGLPGMAVLQFAFDGENSDYLPHNQEKNQVLYSGTHDNDTTLGWYRHAEESTRDKVRRYLRVGGSSISWDMIRAAYQSVCNLAVIPMQDFLSLDSSARMNTPGSATGNWQWRVEQHQLDRLWETSGSYLRELKQLYSR